MPPIIKTVEKRKAKRQQPINLARKVLVRNHFHKPNCYTVIFYNTEQPKIWKRVGMFETSNGSVVDLGKIIHNYIKNNSVPCGVVD